MTEPAPEQPAPHASEAGFDQLFQTGFTRVVRSLLLLGADRSTAEDLAQEAFCTAYQRWDEICSYGSPIAWIAKTALNKWRQHCRISARRHGLLAQADPLQLVKQNRDLAEVDKRLDVQRCLLQLPLRQREVIVLHYILDQSVSSIARTLGVAEGTVKSQLYDARQSLADLMTDGSTGPQPGRRIE
ncbi:RNA polymerase sigma factor [Streptomyces chartreusis]|uniref:RNA polymerase sigma factor n=1 Tax=Streptomyces chartreusis TaxID=1969 RepID=UPI0033FAF1E2